jgi:tRNA(fMet)-specific endonuclease VapC
VTRYLLDTNIVSNLIRNPVGPAAARLALVGEAAVCTSIQQRTRIRPGGGTDARKLAGASLSLDAS